MVVAPLEIAQTPHGIRTRFNVNYQRTIPTLNGQLPGLYAPQPPLAVPLEFVVPNNAAKLTLIRYRVQSGLFALNTVTGANVQLRSECTQVDFGTSAGGDKISVNGNEYIEVIQSNRAARVISGPIDKLTLNNIWVSMAIAATDLSPNALVTINPVNAIAFLAMEIVIESYLN